MYYLKEMQYSREDDMLNPCLECNNRYHKTEACASKYRKPPLTKKRGLNQEELNGLDQVFDRLKGMAAVTIIFYTNITRFAVCEKCNIVATINFF